MPRPLTGGSGRLRGRNGRDNRPQLVVARVLIVMIVIIVIIITSSSSSSSSSSRSSSSSSIFARTGIAEPRRAQRRAGPRWLSVELSTGCLLPRGPCFFDGDGTNTAYYVLHAHCKPHKIDDIMRLFTDAA